MLTDSPVKSNALYRLGNIQKAWLKALAIDSINEYAKYESRHSK